MPQKSCDNSIAQGLEPLLHRRGHRRRAPALPLHGRRPREMSLVLFTDLLLVFKGDPRRRIRQKELKLDNVIKKTKHKIKKTEKDKRKVPMILDTFLLQRLSSVRQVGAAIAEHAIIICEIKLVY